MFQHVYRFLQQKAERLCNFSLFSGLRVVDGAAGVLKDSILASLFGRGVFLDAYFLSIGYLDLVSGYFQQMGYGILVPAYNDRARPDETGEEKPQETVDKEQNDVLVAFLNYMMTSVLLLAVVLVFLHRWISESVAPNLVVDPDSHLDLFMMLTLPASMLFQGAYALRLVLIQQKRFAHVHLPGIVSTLAFIVAVWLLYPVIGYKSLIIGFPASQLLQFAMFWWFLKIRWRFLWKIPDIGKMLRLSLPNTVIFLLFYSFVPLVDNYYLAGLPQGDLAAYSWASKIVTNLGLISVMSLQITMVPMLMSAGSQQDFPAMRSHIWRGIKESCLFSLPMMLGAFLLGPWVIKFIFQRGAFTADDSARVFLCLQILLLKFPYMGSWIMIHTSYSSLYLVKPFIIVGVASFITRVLMDWAGFTFWGLAGVTWMTTLHYYVMMGIGLGLLLVLMRRLEQQEASI